MTRVTKIPMVVSGNLTLTKGELITLLDHFPDDGLPIFIRNTYHDDFDYVISQVAVAEDHSYMVLTCDKDDEDDEDDYA